MMKSGAPPDKFGVLYRIEFHGFTSIISSKGFHSLVAGLVSTFLEMVWVPLSFWVDGTHTCDKRLAQGDQG